MAVLEIDQDNNYNYDNLEWFDDVRAYRCTRCKKFLDEHHIATCGHKFCNKCKKEILAGSQRWRCPNCSQYIRKIDRQDSRFKDTLTHLRVHCPNRKYGCEHIFPVKDIKNHLAKCGRTKENAISVPYREALTAEMLEQKFSEQMWDLRHEIKEIAERMDEFDKRIVDKKVNETEEELNKRKHTLSLEQQVYYSIIKPELQHLRRVSEYYEENPDFSWVANVRGLIAGSANELLSEVFPLTKYPFSAQMKMTLYEYNEISLQVSFNQRKETNEPIKMKLLPNIFLTLIDRSNDKERRHIIKTGYAREFKEKFQYNEFSFICVINKSLLKSAPYNLEDKVKIDIHVEAPEVAQSVYSHDGTLTWAIDDCREKKEMEVDGLIESHLSPYFYTDYYGYRMQLKIRLNGYGDFKNKGLSVLVVFLNSLYDDDLDTQFNYKITVTIFHPQQTHKKISKSEERYYDKRHGRSFDMGSHAEMEDLLYGDALYYKVSIEIVKS